MHLERKYLLLHDSLSRAKAQVLRFRGSDPREDCFLAKKTGTVRQVRANADQGSGPAYKWPMPSDHATLKHPCSRRTWQHSSNISAQGCSKFA